MQEEQWRFKMLGAFEVYRKGEKVPGIHRHKYCQLLAFLAFMRGKHSRLSLCRRFWDGTNDADNNLSQALSKLAAIFGQPDPANETLLQSPRDGTLSLNSELFVRDIDNFDRLLRETARATDNHAKIAALVEAVNLYGGEFMLGYADTGEYDWIKKPRLDYAVKYVGALKSLGAHFRELGVAPLAELCDEHAASSVPLTAEDCTLLRKWNETTIPHPLPTPSVQPISPVTAPVPVPATNRSINPRAVAYYNRGRRWWKLRSEKALRESEQWYRQAMEADPSYVHAYAGMADTYSLLGYYSFLDPRQAVATAKYWVQEARNRAHHAPDEVQSAVLTADAWIKMIYEWNWVEAEEGFIEAILRNPRNETAHQWYSYHLMLQGNTQQSLDEINTAWDYEPQSGIISKSVGERYYYKRLYAKAIEKYREALKDAPNYCLTHSCLGKAYEQQAINYRQAGLIGEAEEMFAEAVAEFRRAIELSDVMEGPKDPSLMAGIAHAYAVSGAHDRARDLLADLKRQRVTAGCYVSPVALATVCLGLDEPEEALQHLESAVDEHPGDLVLIHIDPRFIALRGSARFDAILNRIGLQL